MNYTSLLLHFFSISFTVGLNNHVQAEQSLNNSLSIASKKVTIFIHGTQSSSHFPFNFSSGLKRFDALFSTPQPGLHHYSAIAATSNLVKIAEALHNADPIMFPLDTFYFYGWRGKLSINERRIAAKKLAQELESTIIQPYREQYNITLELTLVTHSHGGNVALNLAREKKLSFRVDTLIMLACPVQHETKKFINAPLFKTIYSFYSPHDTIQVLDPQLLGTIHHGVIKSFVKRSTNPLKKLWQKLAWPLFSSRQFNQTPSLYQIMVNWKDRVEWPEPDLSVYGPFRYFGKKITPLKGYKERGLYHIEFLMPSFIEKIPTIIKKAQHIKKDFTFYLS